MGDEIFVRYSSQHISKKKANGNELVCVELQHNVCSVPASCCAC